MYELLSARIITIIVLPAVTINYEATAKCTTISILLLALNDFLIVLFFEWDFQKHIT